METPRQRARRQTMQDIVRIGRKQLTAGTPADLSLRAVARDLGIVSSAIYRYVKDRDELLTLLIIDAYDELGDEVETAVAEASRRNPRAQMLTACQAMRAWALREPSRFALLFGTPVAGYAAPGSRTVEPGTRVVVALIGIIEAAFRNGDLTLPDQSLPREVRADAEALREMYGLTVPAIVLSRGLGLWSALVGAVSFEVYERYGPDTISDPAIYFEFHMSTIIDTLGF